MGKSRASKLAGRLRKRYSVEGDILNRGIWASFQKNPIGSLIGFAMLMITLYWFSTAAGPFAGSSGLQGDFGVLYTNTQWLGLLCFALVFPVAAASAVSDGGLKQVRGGIRSIAQRAEARRREQTQKDANEEIGEGVAG